MRNARVDNNQADIVAVLREVGATVQPLHFVGRGCPDILVGFRGVNYLMEIKDGNKALSKRQLTPAEREFHATWGGQVAIVEDYEAALAVIGAIGNVI